MQRINAWMIAVVASIALPALAWGQGAPAEKAAPLTAEEIVAKNVEARGGLEAWRDVETVKMEGSMELGEGATAPLTLEFKRPSKVRVQFEVQGRMGVQGFDGETGWALVSAGEGGAIRLSPEQSQELVKQADFEGQLIGYQEKGYDLRLIGTDTVDDRKVYAVELEGEGGEATRYDIDAETFLEVRQSLRRSIENREVEISVRLSDYRKVGDLLIPYRVEQSLSIAPAPQVIRLKSVELNADLPNERFAFPEG